MNQPIKKVDIFINGRTYTVNCPIDEEHALLRASDYINDFIQEIRKQSPQIPHEELLVLCALNLYEKSEILAEREAQDADIHDIVGQMLTYVKTLS